MPELIPHPCDVQLLELRGHGLTAAGRRSREPRQGHAASALPRRLPAGRPGQIEQGPPRRAHLRLVALRRGRAWGGRPPDFPRDPLVHPRNQVLARLLRPRLALLLQPREGGAVHALRVQLLLELGQLLLRGQPPLLGAQRGGPVQPLHGLALQLGRHRRSWPAELLLHRPGGALPPPRQPLCPLLVVLVEVLGALQGPALRLFRIHLLHLSVHVALSIGLLGNLPHLLQLPGQHLRLAEEALMDGLGAVSEEPCEPLEALLAQAPLLVRVQPLEHGLHEVLHAQPRRAEAAARPRAPRAVLSEHAVGRARPASEVLACFRWAFPV
mmetsp:Transcript_25262/g.66756  ORF Transcript_25262/g.66756 Transcript_25262/m.66756 type:complete len:326 (+) Transcript_25262:4442-5419(+)